MLHTNFQQVLTLSQWERSLKHAQDDATSSPFPADTSQRAPAYEAN
jgi:hypothetical protein